MDRQGYCCCFRVTYSKSIFVLQLWTCWTRCWPLTLTRGSRWRRRWHTPTWNNTTTPQMRWVRHLVLYGSPGFKKTAQLLLFYKMIEEQISSFNSRSSAEVLNCFSRCCIPYAVFYIYINTESSIFRGSCSVQAWSSTWGSKITMGVKTARGWLCECTLKSVRKNIMAWIMLVVRNCF